MSAKHYNIVENEEKLIEFWKTNNIFQKSIDNNKDGKSYIFYDGPPFATGLPHYGHILAGLIKDTIIRWAVINGFHVPRRAGFDCHGLPIEFEIEKKLGIKTKEQILNYGIDNYNEACRGIVMSCAGDWKTIMNRIGRWIDFDNDYKTMDINYMSKVWSVFAQIYDKGLIYEGVKIMPYSTACTTPLANFEATSNYQNVSDRTVIVKFKLKNTDNIYILSWTTTPWTLPAHYCLCVNSNITYALVLHNSESYYIAKSRVEFLKAKLKVHELQIISEIKGNELIGMSYEPPFNFVGLNEYYIVADNFVTDDSGTGVVHIAPAYGEDDYKVALKADLITKEITSLFIHIDDNGNSINCGDFSNMPFKEVNKKVLKDLQTRNLSVIIFDYEHNYPFCWRSDTPLIYKAVKCWFVNVEYIKERMITINEGINWIPENIGKSRFNNWLEGTRDWCVSRNRYWGTPIPIWKSEDGEILVIHSKEHLEKLSGLSLVDLHSHVVDKIEINYNDKVYKRDKTVLDCWFESGCVPFASPNTGYPADFIAEGLDQTRGWFYTLLVIGTILEDRSPYQNVIVNGLVLASDGKKMSKRLKNYPDPVEVVNQYGADCLRYYLIMSGASMANELHFNNSEVKEVMQSVIIPLTNSLTFLQEYQIYYNKNKEFKLINSDRPFDKWIMNKLKNFIEKYSIYLNEYKINPISKIFLKFIDNLNNNYIRLNRDVIKGKNDDDIDKIKCQQALSTLCKVLYILSIYVSPILPFLSEIIYQETRKYINYDTPISVHLTNILSVSFESIEDDDVVMINSMLNVIDMIRQIRNKNNIQVKRPLKNVSIYTDLDKLELLKNMEYYIINECNIIDIDYKIWESTKYKYVYEINFKVVGKIFRDKRVAFEKFISELDQLTLEKMFNGFEIMYNDIQLTPELVKVTSNLVKITSDLVKVFQVIDEKNDINIKTEEDIINRIKVKVDIISDIYTEELFIAKRIATNFQLSRKYGGYHPYDSVRLIMDENEFTHIVIKYAEYINKITRTPIEITKEELSSYSYCKVFEIDGKPMKIYLI
jgi:isoleucyl-tRNA synthetase